MIWKIQFSGDTAQLSPHLYIAGANISATFLQTRAFFFLFCKGQIHASDTHKRGTRIRGNGFRTEPCVFCASCGTNMSRADELKGERSQRDERRLRNRGGTDTPAGRPAGKHRCRRFSATYFDMVYVRIYLIICLIKEFYREPFIYSLRLPRLPRLSTYDLSNAIFTWRWFTRVCTYARYSGLEGSYRDLRKSSISIKTPNENKVSFQSKLSPIRSASARTIIRAYKKTHLQDNNKLIINLKKNIVWKKKHFLRYC